MKLSAQDLLDRLAERGFTTDLRSAEALTRAGSGDDAPSSGSTELPERLGPFEILGELGEGGFGSVMLGAQTEPVRRLAAVKLLKRGMDSHSVLARFRGEQQALALMDHPAVATVFESGLSQDGRPWFAMPLVTGIAITQHADLENLGLHARLRLFMQAVAGVQHAHQKGVIHRDLKPANILVGVEAGQVQPRVIDFGIAKAVEGADPLTSLATQGESLVGTPAYMAPEQAAGNAEVRSDLWALGVILGELLCGARPLDHDPHRRADGSVEAARCMRPSDRYRRWMRADPAAAAIAAERRGLAPSSLLRSLEGDLDAIVGKCLEEETRRRYADAGSLLQDLERHLQGMPVLARPPSVTYRTGRFVRRHVVGVTAAAAVTAALLVATVLSVRSAMRAEREARAAIAVTDFLVQMLGAADPWRPGGQQDVTVREALDAAARRLQAGEFLGRPLEQARIEQAIGMARLQLGLAAEALPPLQRAVETRRRLDPRSTATADALHRLGLCLQSLGQLEQAETLLREAMGMHAEVDGPDAVPTLQTLNNLSLALLDQGKAEPAETLLRDAMRRLDAMANPEAVVLAGTQGNLGMLLQTVGRLEDARPFIEAALRTNQSRLDADDLELSMDWNNLGLLLKDLEAYPEAERSLRESLRILEQGLGPRHPTVALVQVNLADLLQRVDKIPEAVSLLEAAAITVEAAYGPDHSEVARTRNLLGFAHRNQGQHAQAERAFREALQVWEKALGPEHPDVATGCNNVARALQDQGRPQEALPYADRAVAVIMRGTDATDPRRWVFVGRRGAILLDAGQLHRAREALQEALAGLRQINAPSVRVRTAGEDLARCLEALHQTEPDAGHGAAAQRLRQELAGPGPG